MFLGVADCQCVATCDAFPERRECKAREINDRYTAQRAAGGMLRGNRRNRGAGGKKNRGQRGKRVASALPAN
jgi:hypothetical protein